MMSRAILGWGSAFDKFDGRDKNFPVTVDQFSNMLAKRAYGTHSKEQWACAHCVSLFLRNNYLAHRVPDAISTPLASKQKQKAPAWKLKRWLASFRLHKRKMTIELEELEKMVLTEACS